MGARASLLLLVMVACSCGGLVEGTSGRTDAGVDAGGGAAAADRPTASTNGALVFTGEPARYAGVDDTSALRPTGPFTIEAWVEQTCAGTGLGVIVAKAYGAATDDSFAIWVKGTLIYAGVRTLDWADTIGAAWKPQKADWVHVAYTHSKAGGTLFVDGKMVAGGGPAKQELLYDDHPVLVGADYDYETLTHPWCGAIDEVRIYPEARTITQILGDMKSRAADGAILHLPFDEGSGATATDRARGAVLRLGNGSAAAPAWGQGFAYAR